MPSPLHCLESSLRGILPVRPLRFTCVTGPGPGPSPSPCSSSSFSSSDEELRPEPAFWQPPLQSESAGMGVGGGSELVFEVPGSTLMLAYYDPEKDHLPSGKGPVPLCPVSGASPRISHDSRLAEEPERTEPGDGGSTGEPGVPLDGSAVGPKAQTSFSGFIVIH